MAAAAARQARLRRILQTPGGLAARQSGTPAPQHSRPELIVLADHIGDAQRNKLAAGEGQQRVIGVASGDRHVLAQPQDVGLVDPGII
jgi:hypothetical protein